MCFENKLVDKAVNILNRKHLNCSLALIDLNGYPTVSPITVSKNRGLEWFTLCTGTRGNKVGRIGKCDRASICFSSTNPLYNITLVGKIEVLTDIDTKKEMWYDGCEQHWESPEDENYCVLKFTTNRYNIMIDNEEVEGVVVGT